MQITQASVEKKKLRLEAVRLALASATDARLKKALRKQVTLLEANIRMRMEIIASLARIKAIEDLARAKGIPTRKLHAPIVPGSAAGSPAPRRSRRSKSS